MKNQTVLRDERTLVVENAGYRRAYFLLAFGLLVIVAVRSFVWRESNWDLLALVVLSGFVTTIYQGAHRILSWRWALVALAAAAAAAIIAAAIVFLR